MATGDRVDPFAQYNFMVEIDGVTRAGFTEASGLTVEQDIIEYREGSEVARARKLPGLTKYTNITLKRGLVGDAELWEWRKSTIDGQTERRAGSIVLLDESRQEVMRWNFVEGWVAKWEGPTLNATANEVAVETLEICHEGLELEV
jgi:phage tail-like protein